MIKLKNTGVVFNAIPHTYHYGDKELKGITGILHRHLFPQKYAGISQEVLDAAAERGSIVHEQCRALDILGEPLSREAAAYAEIKEANKWETVANEYTVTDYQAVASNIDVVLHRAEDAENQLILADFKTTSTFDNEYVSWQLSIYKYLIELCNPNIEVIALYGIWLPPERYGKPKAIKVQMQDVKKVEALLAADREGLEYISPIKKTPEEMLQVQARMTAVLRGIKELEEQSDKMKKQLLRLMEENDLKKWETDTFTCTRVLPGVKKSFDTKKFQKEHEKLYKEYIINQPYNGSIRIKLK